MNGWERALFFPRDRDFVDRPSFRFTETRSIVAEEVRAVQNCVGLSGTSGFARFEVSGSGAAAWLDGLYTSPIPRVGRVSLIYSVSASGRQLSELTVARLEEDRFWLGAAATAEWHERDWLNDRLADGTFRFTNLTSTYTTLVVAGPRSRELLQSLSPRSHWSRAAFPWLAVREVHIGAHKLLAMSVSFSGELAFELQNENLYPVHCLIEDAGRSYGLQHFGLYAVDSMRLEKGYRSWKADLLDEVDPFEAGLSRFVRLGERRVEGSQALADLASAPKRRKFVVMTLECEHAPAHADDSIWVGATLAGSVTSGGWGYRTGRNIAFGYVAPECSALGHRLEVDVVGERVPAVIVPECLYDPDHERIRG